MKVLVTRPIEDGAQTARQLALRGHQALLAPLLTTQFLDGPDVELTGVQAVLATSANGVRALARRTRRRDVAVFAVGPQTAAEARAAGFVQVKSANGDAAALAQCTRTWATPDAGALLQVVGAGNDGKLAGMLAGFALRQETLYAVSGIDTLPPAAAEGLRRGDVDAALFFSPRSAAIFRDCALKENLPTQKLIAAAISATAAAALAPLTFGQIRVAGRPNQNSLLELLD